MLKDLRIWGVEVGVGHLRLWTGNESEDVVLLPLNCQVGIWREVGKKTLDDDEWWGFDGREKSFLRG